MARKTRTTENITCPKCHRVHKNKHAFQSSPCNYDKCIGEPIVIPTNNNRKPRYRKTDKVTIISHYGGFKKSATTISGAHYERPVEDGIVFTVTPHG